MSSETKFSPQNLHLIAIAGNSNHFSFGTCKPWFLKYFYELLQITLVLHKSNNI